MSDGNNKQLPERVRGHLKEVAAQGTTITYQALAEQLAVRPPNRIHQVAMALERLMREDASGNQPFIAALVVSKRRHGLPAPGFFELARRLGRFQDEPSESAMHTYHRSELEAALTYWAQKR